MAIAPPLPADEPLRLQALRQLNLVETPLQEHFERITRIARGALNVDIAAISLIEADRQFFKSIQGLDICETPRDISFCGHAILLEDLLYVPNAPLDPRFADNPLVVSAPHVVTYAGVPVCAPGGYKIGTLCVMHSAVRNFTFDDLQLLRDLAALTQLELDKAASNAVQAMLLEQISVEHRRALVDPLTRMWNRTGIVACADDAIAAQNQSFALVVIDLDGFKHINDSFGHFVGDEVLRAAAKRMLAALPESDALGRTGGDEFLCILRNCASPRQAVNVAARVRQRITASPVKTSAGLIPLTASFGVRFVHPNSDSAVEQLIDSADQAMYQCKRDRRDDVCLFDPAA